MTSNAINNNVEGFGFTIFFLWLALRCEVVNKSNQSLLLKDCDSMMITCPIYRRACDEKEGKAKTIHKRVMVHESQRVMIPLNSFEVLLFQRPSQSSSLGSASPL